MRLELFPNLMLFAWEPIAERRFQRDDYEVYALLSNMSDFESGHSVPPPWLHATLLLKTCQCLINTTKPAGPFAGNTVSNTKNFPPMTKLGDPRLFGLGQPDNPKRKRLAIVVEVWTLEGMHICLKG
jgi:hypothetical protein